MDFISVFKKMMELFFIIVIGFATYRAGVINSDVKKSLTKVVLKISLPCTILSSVMNAAFLPNIKEIGRIVLVAFLSYVVYFVIAKISGKLLGLKGKQKGAAEFALIFSNVGFVGYPVTYAIFGPDSVFYTCIFNLPFNVVCYSLGVMLLNAEDKASKKKGSTSETLSDNKSDKDLSGRINFLKLMLTPALISSIIALVMALINWQGPKLIGEMVETVGAITTPGALLIIGCALAELELSQMFNNWKVYVLSIISVLVTPIIAFITLSPLAGGDMLLIGEAVIISGMPVATAGTMLCVEYGGDERFMAQLTFVSTVLSLVTIPLFAVWLSI